MKTIAKKVRELGESCGMRFLLVDSDGRPYDEELDIEIPPLILALSKATNSRSSTVIDGVQITAVFLGCLREKPYLVVLGEFREENAYRLLKGIIESQEVNL
jgi:hypothetical protein